MRAKENLAHSIMIPDLNLRRIFSLDGLTVQVFQVGLL